MFCPQCGSEFRPEFTRCNSCDVELVHRPVIRSSGDRNQQPDLILPFFLITYTLTWGSALLAMASSLPPFTLILPAVLGAFAPSLAALSGIAVQEGTAGVVKVLRGFLIWHVNSRWYVFAIFYMPALMLLLSLGSYLLAGVRLTPMQSWSATLIAAVLRIPVLASEEIGWRGFALPRLTKRFGLRNASLVLGVLWAAWHLLRFATPSWAGHGTSLPAYIVQVMALSAIFAWLYAGTRGSLLLVTLFHSVIDATLFSLPRPPHVPSLWALPVDVPTWLFLGLLWITATYCLKAPEVLNPYIAMRDG